jgi:hypothetical protein
MFIKWSSLQEGVSKLTPRFFMRLKPGAQCYEYFYERHEFLY